MPNENPLDKLAEYDGHANVIEAFEEREITELGNESIEEYRIDRESRADWEKNAREAMQTVLQTKRDKNYPFPNASNVRVPLLTTAALQFAARAYPAIVQTPKLVRAEIIGRDANQQKQERGERIETHMSYQLLKEMKGWESDTDTLLHQIPAVGCAFRKVFWCEEEKRPDARLIPAMDFVVNQATTSLDTVPRASHRFDLYPHEIQSRIRSGTFAEFDWENFSSDSQDEGFRKRNDSQQDKLAAHSFIEQHRYHDLDDDGYAEPWIVTLHESSEKIVRVAPNFALKQATLNRRGQLVHLPAYKYFVKYGFVPDPAGGFYDVGFGLLLKTLSDAIDTSLNQMIDAAHLQNAGGGFIGSGLNMKKSELRFSPGVYHVVNAPGNVVRDAVVQMQHPGPSQALFNLLTMLIELGKQVTAVQDIMTGDVERAQPATTTLAQIEQGLKVFSAIYKRIFRALGEEYKLLYDINFRYPDQEKYLKVLDWQPPGLPPQAQGMPQAMPGQMEAESAAPPGAEMIPQPGMVPPQMGPVIPPIPIMRQDYAYDDCDIYPVADPHMVTDMQRLAKAQVLLELSGHPVLGPQLNASEVAKRVLLASNIENVSEVIPPKQGPSPAEQLQLAGAQAQLADVQASAKLKEAQAQKAMAEAQNAGTEGTDHIALAKLHMEAVDKDQKHQLEVEKHEQAKYESQRQFEADQLVKQQELARAEDEADRQFQADREDAIVQHSLNAQSAGHDAFNADQDRQAKKEQAEADREDQKREAEAERRAKIEAERIRAAAKGKLNKDKK